MAKLVNAPPATPPPGVVEQTITQKQLIPAPPPAAEPEPKQKQDRQSLGEWFASLKPDERDLYYYYIKRLDPNIRVTNELFDGARGGKYLYKLSNDDLLQLSEGDFESELCRFLGEKFGGGMYSLMATHKHYRNRVRNAVLEVDGAPKLSEREGWKDGRPPAFTESTSVLPQVIQMVREEIRKVGEHQKAPEASVSDITNTILSLNQTWSTRLVEMMSKGPTPQEQMQQTLALLQSMQTLQGNAPKPAESADPFAQFNNVLTVVQKVRELDRTPQSDKPIAEVVRDVATQVVSEKLGGRRGGSDWGWVVAVADKLAPAAMRLAEAGVEYLRYRSSTGAPAVRNVQRPTQFQPAPGPMPAPAPAPSPAHGGFAAPAPRVNPAAVAAPEVNAPGTPSPEAASPAAEGPIEIPAELVNAMMIEYAAQRIVDALQHDTPGDAVADSLSLMFPQVAVMMRFMTEDQIMAYVRANPILQAVANDPRLPKFVKEFAGYFKESEGEGHQE